jgi:hypothetical protein
VKYVIYAVVSSALSLSVYIYLLWGRPWLVWVGVGLALFVSSSIAANIVKKRDDLRSQNDQKFDSLEKRLSRLMNTQDWKGEP